MIARYVLPEMATVWAETRRILLWKEIEALAAEGWEDVGAAPPGTAAAVRAAETPTADEVAARERETQHDLAAFVDLLAARAGDAGRWVHYGLTSSDVLDTATAVQLDESSALLLGRAEDLFETVRGLALLYRDSEMVGRTHGVWAEPTTFGLKLASWAFELARDHTRLRRARQAVAVGKLSGAVGTYAHVRPEIEALVCDRLGLSPEPASTQVTARDRHAEYLQALALFGASIERFSTEVRHLARSEVGEVAEPFGSAQKGSSAMPHKRNPVVSERMAGLARLLRGYANVGLENVALWHERDISHSSAERVVLPDASHCLFYMLVKFHDVMEGLVVDTSRMRDNLEAAGGLVFSQTVLHGLIDSGMARDDAYQAVQRASTAAIDTGRTLREALAEDEDVGRSGIELEEAFSTKRLLALTGHVFDRLEALSLR